MYAVFVLPSVECTDSWVLGTECDHVPPPLAILHTPNMSGVKLGICVDKWRDVPATELCATMYI